MLMPAIFILTGSWCRKSCRSFLVYLLIGWVGVAKARRAVEPGVPAATGIAGDGDRALVERLALVVQLRQVDVGDGAPAFAARAHAPGAGGGAPHGLSV